MIALEHSFDFGVVLQPELFRSGEVSRLVGSTIVSLNNLAGSG